MPQIKMVFTDIQNNSHGTGIEIPTQTVIDLLIIILLKTAGDYASSHYNITALSIWSLTHRNTTQIETLDYVHSQCV